MIRGSKSVHTVIVGAGLSGLVTAYNLKTRGFNDFIILEARDRLGGRIWTKEGLDLGGTWFQSHHQSFIQLLKDLGINIFRQYTTGKSAFMYSSMAPFQYFENDQDTAAFRVEGGSKNVIEKLSENVQQHIQLNEAVHKMEIRKEDLRLSTCEHQYSAQKVVFALPPQLLLNIEYTPNLPDDLQQVLSKTHTWMSNAFKIGIEYERAFWRDKGLSGTIIGHIAPVIELYDHVSSDGQKTYLMGFINEGLRSVSLDNRKERILSYLENHFGPEIRNYKNYVEHDWSEDRWTTRQPLNSVYISPTYGHPTFDKFHCDNRVLFSGAETSAVHGGYMDGAVRRGMWAALRLPFDSAQGTGDSGT